MVQPIRTLICGLVALAGCQGPLYPEGSDRVSEDDRPYPPEEVRGVHPVEAPDGCVLVSDEVDVRTAPVEEGVAMVFTTTGDVEALRERVRDLGERYEALGGRPMMWEVMAPVGRRPSDDALVQDEMPTANAPRGVEPRSVQPLPDADVRYEDDPRGARLVFVAEDEGEREQLARQLREHPEHMARGMCMMEQGAPPPQVAPDADER